MWVSITFSVNSDVSTAMAIFIERYGRDLFIEETLRILFAGLSPNSFRLVVYRFYVVLEGARPSRAVGEGCVVYMVEGRFPRDTLRQLMERFTSFVCFLLIQSAPLSSKRH